MNAFERLGLEERLELSEEEVREAFRKTAAAEHPDSGGDELVFAEIQAAQEILLSSSKRLKEWVRAKGLPVQERGQIDGGLIELFEKVSQTGAEAESLIKENEKAQSALVRAMVEVKLMKAREKLTQIIREIGSAIKLREEVFSEIERGDRDAGEIMRDLAFLEKWNLTLKSLYARLLL
ncbi:MAG: DnaJ domain-containing protein [Akkermansiaceae bacterium]